MTVKVELSEKEKEQIALAKELGAKDIKIVSDFVEDNTDMVIGIGCAIVATAVVTATIATVISKKKNSEKARMKKAAKAKAKAIAKAKKRKNAEQVDAFLDGEDIPQEEIFDVEKAEEAE